MLWRSRSEEQEKDDETCMFIYFIYLNASRQLLHLGLCLAVMQRGMVETLPSTVTTTTRLSVKFKCQLIKLEPSTSSWLFVRLL
jgi:hypothetical protein